MTAGQRVAHISQRARGVFYGWWLVAGGVGLQVLIAAALNQSYGAYVVVLQQQFGWSKTAFSGAYAIQQMESGLLGPIQGWLLDRFGPRRVMRAGILLLGVGFVTFSQISSLAGFYVAFLILAIGSGLAGFMSITTTIVHWFERRRATALGIMQTGGAIGGLTVPVVAWSLTHFGWRSTAFASGVVIIAVGIPLTGLFRRRPEEYGFLPDGAAPGEIVAGAERFSADPHRTHVDFTAREALRAPTFWFLSMGHACAMFVVAGVQVHLISALKDDYGFSLAQGAGVVSLMTGSLLVGQLSGGMLGDRFSKRWIATCATCGHVVAMLALALRFGPALVIAAAMLQGLSHGVRGVQMMPMRADYFGRTAFATIAGFSSLVMIWGLMAGPLAAGLLADHFGSYRWSFVLLATVGAVGVAFFALSRKPAPPRRARAA